MGVVCKLCGFEYMLITASHLRSWHGISIDTYREMFPGVETVGWDYVALMARKCRGIPKPSLSEERKEEISEFHKELWTDPDYRKTMLKKFEDTVEVRGQHISEALTGRTYSPEHCRAISEGKLGFHHSQETKDKISRTKKAQYKNPDYAREMAEAQRKKPNSDEVWLGIYLDRHFPGKWKYVGDGQVWIGGRNPDFISTNGRKLVIELFGNYWHEEEEVEERRLHYSKFGCNCLILWDDEVLEELVVETVKSFEEDFNACSI